jgi:hypothetical protein
MDCVFATWYTEVHPTLLGDLGGVVGLTWLTGQVHVQARPESAAEARARAAAVRRAREEAEEEEERKRKEKAAAKLHELELRMQQYALTTLSTCA